MTVKVKGAHIIVALKTLTLHYKSWQEIERLTLMRFNAAQTSQ
jgi:hypothetical protein